MEVDIGTFENGEIGSSGYSIDLDLYHRMENDSFDIMIQYGGEDHFDVVRKDI